MMDMLDIAVPSSVVVHQVNSDVVALLDVGEQVISRVNRIVFHLEIREGFDVEDLYLHANSCQLLHEKLLSGV